MAIQTCSTRDEVTPNTCKHYNSVEEVPQDIRKYYHQRYTLFSKYDDGILVTDDAWFGVTPEPVANKLAEHISDGAPISKAILIDCFAGIGGNTIAFARSSRWKRIYAIEKDEDAIICAKHNAKLYGVDHRISWFHGDCFQVVKDELTPLAQYSVVFASPPWGGPGYSTDATFDLTTMRPYSLREMLQSFRQAQARLFVYTLGFSALDTDDEMHDHRVFGAERLS
ncbi:MAG: hypothetical protein Q9179_004977 [Wetmoreana sp. 5 TL-2023]